MPYYAFFDVDDTLISIKSMFRFQEFWYAATGDRAGQDAFAGEFAALRAAGAAREELNRRYYAHFAGRSAAAVAECAERWFAHVEATTPGLWHAPVVARLKAHQAAGIEAVFVSGSFPALLEPVARRLSVGHLLCTTMEQAGGRFTGAILPPQTIGDGKARAVAGFLARTHADPAGCFAYGDDISDLPMLAAVGHPTAVRGCARLAGEAKARGWEVLAAA
ncbi:MAG: HAD family hydrolase [Actinomycetota bacterium]